MSVSEIFEIPKFYYFKSDNGFSGSKGSFSYKIVNEEKMKCLVWHGKMCSMKAEIEEEAEFEKTQEGFESMIKWLEETYLKGEK